jgi:hypothetical protein
VYNIGLNKNNNEVFVTVLHIFYYVKNLWHSYMLITFSKTSPEADLFM